MRKPILPSSSRWGVFIISAVILFFITMIGIGVITPVDAHGHVHNTRASILVGSVLQGVLLFIMPTVLAWGMTSVSPWKVSGISERPGLRNIGYMLLLYIIALPAMNQIIWFNQHAQLLPQSMSGLEEKIRAMEESANAMTMLVLSSPGVGAMLINVLIIGILTGIAEELFFRAGIQRMLTKSGVNAKMSIWIAAFIFSAVHMQFYGFIPRLLLGAMFGFVYMKTGSIWTSASMHALNNSLVIVGSWMQQRGWISSDLDTLFVATSGFPVWFLLSATLTIWFVVYSNHHQIFSYCPTKIKRHGN